MRGIVSGSGGVVTAGIKRLLKVRNTGVLARSTDFYLVKVEAVRIGESAPAPLLTLIVGPSEEAKSAGQTKKQLAER